MSDDNNKVELMDTEPIEIEASLPLTEIPDGSVTTPKLADRAVTPEKLDREYLTEQSANEKINNLEHPEGAYIGKKGREQKTKEVIYGAEEFNQLNGVRINKALGEFSHAQGYGTTAKGKNSHAEGEGTKAYGNDSHAEGYLTEAHGIFSHTEGEKTRANGPNNHAEGYGTIAQGEEQHVQGRFNIEDTEKKYAHIVGNGTKDERSNAHTVDWEGNGWFLGDVYVGTDKKKLVTDDFTVTTDKIENNAVTPEKLDREYIEKETFDSSQEELIEIIQGEFEGTNQKITEQGNHVAALIRAVSNIVGDPDTDTPPAYLKNVIVTAEDKGKFLRVNDNGEVVAETVQSFEEAEF